MTAAAADLSFEDGAYLDYHVRWRAGDTRPGKHAARQSGSGGNFRNYRPFWQLPDARHIDVRRSIVDPSGDVVVRQMEQRSSISLVLAADVSRSMAPGAARSSLAAVSRLAQAAAKSALRAGDAFGFVAFDRALREELTFAPTRRKSLVRALDDRLDSFEPDGRSATGILDVPAALPTRRCLLLLASDFLMPLDVLERALQALDRHDVAPIVLGGVFELSLPRAGLLRVRDVETGGTRLLLMRPALHRRWRAAAAERAQALTALFARYGRRAFYAGAGEIDIGAVSQHLVGL